MFSFGQSTQQQQKPAFGFGASSTPAATPGFGGFGTAPTSTAPTFGTSTATSQPSFGLSTGTPGFATSNAGNMTGFGTSTAGNTTGFGGFNTSTATTGGFGLGNTTSTPGFGLGGSMTMPGFVGLNSTNTMSMSLGAPQLAPQQQQQQQESAAIMQELDNIMAAYNAQDSRCRFRHAFYNLVAPEDVPRYQRPAHIPEGLWNEAVQASPDPKCMVPVFASGFGDLQKRIEHQNHQIENHRLKMKEIIADLDSIQKTEQVELSSRLLKCQREHVRLSQKVLKVMKMVQILRAKGHTVITSEEEELWSRFASLSKHLHKPDFAPKAADLLEQVKLMKSLTKNAGASKSDVQYEVLDESALENIFKLLKEMQDGLQYLTSMVKKDTQEAQTILEGYTKRAGTAIGGTVSAISR